jgi:hypothetical protein
MRKIYHIIWAIVIISSLPSCDYLDKKTFNVITPDQVWENPKTINSVMVNLYDGLQLDDFNYWYREAWRLMNPTALSDEAQGSFQKDPMFDNGNTTYTYEDYLFELKFSGVYKKIRNCNLFIAQAEKATSLTDEERNKVLAEARFIRAMHYFSLVKRYGGVPLVTEAQTYDAGNVDDLMVSRNKEVEIYDFIIAECNDIAPKLPPTNEATAKYRANRGTVLALCSRAALYAGSIARYGTVKLDGLVGIPSSEANRFFQISYDASKAIFGLNIYFLYDKKADKAQNYCDMFLKGNGDNSEFIFQKQYNVAGGKGHDWDKRNAPFSYRGGGWGCGMAPTLELVESYEYTDGSDGALRLTETDGTPRRFDNVYDLFAGKDPRLFASVFLPGSSCKGSKIEWKRGIIVSDNQRYAATSQPDGGNTVTVNGVKYNISGKDGGADAGDASKTGFYQKKFFDETLTDMNMGKSETPWPVFRLAESYLNLAEACLELGGAEKEAEALAAVNALRSRAGIKTLDNITMEKVRHERRIELAFEGHRFWDMKRWRIAHLDVSKGGLNGFRGTALYPWLDIRDNKFIFETGKNTPKETRIFLERNYYTKINSEDMNSNPNIGAQNPDYTN